MDVNNTEKLQYIKNNYVEFDKNEIIKEFVDEDYMTKQLKEKIEKLINNYKYYRLMSDGKKMFFSEDYLKKHSIRELEKIFYKIN